MTQQTKYHFRMDGGEAEEYFLINTVDTTDNTSTTILTIEVPEKSFLALTITGGGTRDDFSDSYVIRETTAWRRAGGGSVGSFTVGTDLYEYDDSAGTPTVIVSADTASTVIAEVTGITAQNWSWVMAARVVIRTLP
jgi:hypothetical protein